MENNSDWDYQQGKHLQWSSRQALRGPLQQLGHRAGSYGLAHG
jgi:hypothetical protein